MMGYGFGYSSFDIMFTLVLVFIGIIFVFVIGGVIFTIVQGARQWHRNNESPVLTVSAAIVGKRQDVSYHHHHHNNRMGHTSSTTWYYVTFEVESGDRMEFAVDGREYGMLIEGDRGRLTFQGTRYKGFDRM